MFRKKAIPFLLILVVILLSGCAANPEFKLNVQYKDNYSGDSKVVIEPNQESYSQGDEVNLTAYPKNQFKHWQISVLDSEESNKTIKSNPTTVAISEIKDVKAVFSDTEVKLDVVRDTGGGMFGWLGELMQSLLAMIYNLTNSYGLSIIILTLGIKLILYPLTHKQTVSMKKMQKLQPEMEKMKEKYGDNQQKLQEETMKLYQKHKINPLSGCLPLVIQMPFLLALYRSLRGWEELVGQSFLMIPDLSQSYMPLVLLTGLVTLLQSLLTQNVSIDDIKSDFGEFVANNRMAFFMPLFIIFIGSNLPAGVLLYWFISNLIMVVQQYIIAKQPDIELKEESN
ncbi:YidC/Oxa1 family membrane protein insertase [Orenia marismortui]|uniref:YidC/Oxa1 family membrane protein insertase n=1 Tax=Orenia marismortui TaxID=46469 RepID=A0A4R8GYW7_9FIRM|nr:YidC/Oxa1 family membrane protein insertase [Orenia marismortui]TDX51770.1 YidC/Oxa1 family membrane protein insertase [Orenia marismortui]